MSVPVGASPALVQSTSPAEKEHPGADTKVVPAGRTSRRVYPALSDGPRFSTFTVYVSSVPAVAGSGDAVLVTLRSASVFTVVVVSEWLLAVFGSEVVESAVAVLSRW